ncbi:hypothetical protein [Hymenobacter sp. BT491]|uniref:hypothetical protein n=1 Tax=Hymenobacter sp. BT491 TaxID=2766779 RepID=UPI001653671C|nr:hypothetical protein [Hymenobacter sp. BT491]MBC6989124.1 hypothetical protein [Hymenobacter sp. BT491]
MSVRAQLFAASLSALSLLTATGALAQQAGLDPAKLGLNANENLRALAGSSNTAMVFDNRYEGIKGTPYAIPRWLPAKLALTSNIPVASVLLKYDVFKQRLLIRDPSRPDSLLLDANKVTGFALTDPSAPDVATGQPRVRQFRRFAEAPVATQKAEFVEVLYEGKYSLLRRYAKEMEKADYKGAYSTDQRFDELTDKSIYYLRSPEGAVAPVKLNLKALQAAAPSLAPALKAESSKRPLKTAEDAASLLRAAEGQ